jgi:hypothetical protein
MVDPQSTSHRRTSAALLRVVYAVAAILAIYYGFVGAQQLPESLASGIVAAWGIPALLVVWARAEEPRIGRTVAGLHGGIWFLLFGPLLIPYYLARTRRHRSWKVAATVLLAVASPYLGFTAGAVAGAAADVPPRFVELSDQGPWVRVTPEAGRRIVARDFETWAAFLGALHARRGAYPTDVDALYETWGELRRRERAPFDPFTGRGYWYQVTESGYVILSAGPDHRFDTADDLWYLWPER